MAFFKIQIYRSYSKIESELYATARSAKHDIAAEDVEGPCALLEGKRQARKEDDETQTQLTVANAVFQ